MENDHKVSPEDRIIKKLEIVSWDSKNATKCGFPNLVPSDNKYHTVVLGINRKCEKVEALLSNIDPATIEHDEGYSEDVINSAKEKFVNPIKIDHNFSPFRSNI